MKNNHTNIIVSSEMPEINIFSSAEMNDKDINRHTISVSYPKHWFAPVELSTFAMTIEEVTINWMTSLGLVLTPKVLAHLRAMEPRHYAGYSHSMANYDHALIYCKYITMWLLWDDERVEVADDYMQVHVPLQALAGDNVDTQMSDPYIVAFKYIGDEYERLGATREWRVRFATSMMEWAKHAVEEEIVRRKGSENQPNRSFMEAVKLRAVTVGIRPNSIPLERAVGIELLAEIPTDPDYKALIDRAARICCIVNDLVGVPKDIQNNQIKSNLVLYHRICFKTSLLESYHAILDLHDQAIDEYDKLAEKLLLKVDPDFRERLQTFISHIRYMDTGFGFWHRDCIRYQELVAVENKLAFCISINERLDNFQNGNLKLV